MRSTCLNFLRLSSHFYQYFRLLIVLVTLILTLYYTAYLYIAVPFFDFDAAWRPDNVLVVIDVPVGGLASPYLQPEDKILAIDGIPAHQHIWQPLYTPGKMQYTYDVQRGDEIYAFTIPVDTNRTEVVVDALIGRSLTGLAALSFWVVGALVILFATLKNREAWFLGLVILATAVVLAASEAALYNVPTAWLLSNPLYPLVGVLLIRLAFLPQSQPLSPFMRSVLKILYGAATALGLVALFELLYLVPKGQSVELLIDVSLYDVLVWPLALGATAHVVILLIRFWLMPKSYMRQQVLILLVFTGLGIVPGQILTWYPWLFFNGPVLPWNISNILLVSIPIGYAFVIYRRRYLQLDIFVTNSLTFLLLVTFWLTGQAIYAHFLRDLNFFQLSGMSPGLLIVPLLLATLYINHPTRRRVQSLLYGFQKPYQQNLSQIAAHLSSTDPQIDVLHAVFHEAVDLLQVRQAALMLTDNRDKLLNTIHIQTEEIPPLRAKEITLPLTQPCLYYHPKDVREIHSCLDSHDWIRLVAPLRVQGNLIGLLLLGPPIPDEYFNAQDVAFVQQLTDMVAVGVRQIQLFESSRIMSRKNLQVRDEERFYLATQIHDVSLQRVSRIATALKNLTHQTESLSPQMAAQLRQHSSDLYEVAQRLRETCEGLYSPLRRQGVQWAVQDAVRQFQEEGDWKIHLDIDMTTTVAPEIAASVYHTLLEALNNIQKHAQATAVWVDLHHTDDTLYLSVEDNGCGLHFSSLSMPDLLRAHHFGLVNMYEWASLVGGELTIRSCEGGGTAVDLTVASCSKEIEHVCI